MIIPSKIKSFVLFPTTSVEFKTGKNFQKDLRRRLVTWNTVFLSSIFDAFDLQLRMKLLSNQLGLRQLGDRSEDLLFHELFASKILDL